MQSGDLQIDGSLAGKRYRLTFFDYGSDFDGRHFFKGPRQGYVSPDKALQVAGWVVPGDGADKESPRLQLQIMQGAKILESVPVEFSPSPDVARKFPGVRLATHARYALSIPLSFLKDDEYVFRLSIRFKGRKPSKLWDVCLLKDDINKGAIFVIGSPRAGTTAIGNALRAALGAANYGEHHFVYLADKIERIIETFFREYHTRNDYGTFLNEISAALVTAKMQQQIKELYASWQGGRYFVDKTPGRNMLLSVPTILKIWPEAKLIFCKRRAYENVMSRLQKFPHLTTEEHARQWVEVMQMWRSHKERLSSSCYMEIDQIDIRNQRRNTCASLARFVGEDIEGDLNKYLSEHSPQRSSYKETTLSPKQVKVIREICGAEMKTWGYHLDYRG